MNLSLITWDLYTIHIGFLDKIQDNKNISDFSGCNILSLPSGKMKSKNKMKSFRETVVVAKCVGTKGRFTGAKTEKTRHGTIFKCLSIQRPISGVLAQPFYCHHHRLLLMLKMKSLLKIAYKSTADRNMTTVNAKMNTRILGTPFHMITKHLWSTPQKHIYILNSLKSSYQAFAIAARISYFYLGLSLSSYSQSSPWYQDFI